MIAPGEKANAGMLAALVGVAGAVLGGILYFAMHTADEPAPAAGSSGPVVPVNATPVPGASWSAEDALAGTLQALADESDPVADTAVGDLPESLARLARHPSADAAALGERLARRWAETDPAAAAAWVSRLPDGGWRDRALDQIALAWARRDPRAAGEWALQLADEAGDRVLLGVAGEIARTRPKEALDLATALPPGNQRDELIRRAAAEWAAQDPGPATEWARQIESPPLREQVAASMAIAQAGTDPEAAMLAALAAVSPGRLQADTVVSILQRWAQQRPEDAAAVAEQIPPGTLKSAAIENVATIWSRTDAAQASQWRLAQGKPR